MKGFSALNHLSSGHKNTQNHTHVQRYLQIELFEKQQRDELLFDAQRRNDITRRNE
jgi:hypothetical protein